MAKKYKTIRGDVREAQFLKQRRDAEREEQRRLRSGEPITKYAFWVYFKDPSLAGLIDKLAKSWGGEWFGHGSDGREADISYFIKDFSDVKKLYAQLKKLPVRITVYAEPMSAEIDVETFDPAGVFA